MPLFWDIENCCKRDNHVFFHVPWDSYTLDVKNLDYTQMQEELCYISVVLIEYLFENLHTIFSFKVLYVSNFIIIYKKDLSLQ